MERLAPSGIKQDNDISIQEKVRVFSFVKQIYEIEKGFFGNTNRMITYGGKYWLFIEYLLDLEEHVFITTVGLHNNLGRRVDG